MSEDRKFKFASAALHAVAPRDLGLAGGMLANLGGVDRTAWRRVYETAHHCGIDNLSAASLIDQRPFIEAFFQSVLGQTVDASALPLSAPESHPALMINPHTLDFPELVERIEKYFGLPKSFQYKDLLQLRSTTLGRPAEQYTFAHVGGAERDMPGVSYNKAKADKLCFLDETEYTLATAYSKWRHGHFLDVSGWTRLDALWSGAWVVCGGWSNGKLHFGWCELDYDNANSGPRSAIIL